MRNMERDETGEVGGGQTVNVPISHVFFFFFNFELYHNLMKNHVRVLR